MWATSEVRLSLFTLTTSVAWQCLSDDNTEASNTGKQDKPVYCCVCMCLRTVVKMFAPLYCCALLSPLMISPNTGYIRHTHTAHQIALILPVCGLSVNSKAKEQRSFLFGQLVFSLIEWCSIVENHWALRRGLLFIPLAVLMDSMQVFLWNPPTRCTCSQAGRQERGWSFSNVALFIRQELWHHQSRKSGPRGSLALRKMKQRMKQMKYAWTPQLTELLLLYAQWSQDTKVFWEIIVVCHCLQGGAGQYFSLFHQGQQIRMWMVITNKGFIHFVSTCSKEISQIILIIRTTNRSLFRLLK